MDKVFIDGMSVKRPHENAPDFIVVKGLFNVAKIVEFLKANASDGWVNFEIKEAKSGSLYAELDTWKPKKQGESPDNEDDDFPF